MHAEEQTRGVVMPTHEGSRGAARGRRGKTTLQHAVVLGVVASGALVACGSLGMGLCDCLCRLTTEVEEGARVGECRSPAMRVARAPGDPAPRSIPVGLPAIFAAGCLVAVGTAGLTWQLRRGRRRQGENPDDEGMTATLTDLQHRCLFEKRQQILGIFREDMAALLGNRVEVRHVMSTDLITVGPFTPAEQVRRLMSGKRIRHLLVCDAKGNLLGLVSDRDLEQRKGKWVSALMTRRPATISPESRVGPAVTLLLDRHISCLPVVKDGTLMGVFTSTDVMMALQCALQILERLAAELKHPGEPEAPTTAESTVVCPE